MDEQWSYVQNKQQQRWLWYALDKVSSKVVAYTFGSRADNTLKALLKKLKDSYTLLTAGVVTGGYWIHKNISLAKDRTL